MTDINFLVEDSLLYKDSLILIINKPSGIAVHRGRGPAPNLEAYLPQLQYDLPKAPELAHRLDKDTSGCLILGRNRHGLRTMATLFETGQVKKTYWAIVHGRPSEPQGRIQMPLANQTGQSYHWRMKCDPEGKPAITDYEIIETLGAMCLLKLTPLTGRTHQLRVHCAHLGCPIVGDPVYGHEALDAQLHHSLRLHLHAQRVQIPLYYQKPPIDIEAPLPEHMKQRLTRAT